MRPRSHEPDSGRGRLATAATLVLALLAGLVAFAPAAYAHHATGGGQYRCDAETGEWVITWTITNPEASWNAANDWQGWSGGWWRNWQTTTRVMVIDDTDPEVSFTSTELDRGESATAVQVLPGSTSGTQVLEVDVHWEWEQRRRTWFGSFWGSWEAWTPQSGHDRTETFQVTLEGTCEAPTWGFSVSKNLVDPEGVVAPGKTFTVHISCAGGAYTDSQTMTVGSAAVFNGIPEAATPCVVTEVQPTGGLPGGYAWTSPTYSPGQHVSIGDDCVTYSPGGVANGIELFAVRALEPCVTVNNNVVPPPPPPPPGTPPPPPPPPENGEVGGIVEAPPAVEGIEEEAAPVTLPRTGTSPAGVALTGLGLALLGAVLMGLERRRPSPAGTQR